MNEIIIEKIPGGRFKITTPGGFSPELHVTADELVKLIESECGGKTIVQRNPHGHHSHSHKHGTQDHTH
jgi:hypothetical protein